MTATGRNLAGRMNHELVTYAVKFGDQWLGRGGWLVDTKAAAARFYRLSEARKAARPVGGRIVKIVWRKTSAERLRDVGGKP